jgi:cyclopropane fatty-acyl-phospholipid synthase-like methyltransferase
VQDLLDRVVETIADLVPEKGSVLDLGCGTGRYLRALRPRVGADLYGIDLSQATIENYTRKLEGVSAAAGDFAQGNPFGVRFDLIYSITVIQYVPFFKLGRFFGAVRGALKERGRFYLQFPHGGREASLHANYAYTRYRPDYLMRRVSDAGFEVLASGFMDPEHRGDFGYYLLAERAW